MKPIKHIRVAIFGVSQAEFADIAGATQPTVSRWERGELDPGFEEMVSIRTEAHRRGLSWNDKIFFDAPRPKRRSA
jgi:predicted transcriptional regulator